MTSTDSPDIRNFTLADLDDITTQLEQRRYFSDDPELLQKQQPQRDRYKYTLDLLNSKTNYREIDNDFKALDLFKFALIRDSLKDNNGFDKLYNDNFNDLKKYLNKKELEVEKRLEVEYSAKQQQEDLSKLQNLYESKGKRKPTTFGVIIPSFPSNESKITKLELLTQDRTDKYNELRKNLMDEYGIKDTQNIIHWLTILKPIYHTNQPANYYYYRLPFLHRQPNILQPPNDLGNQKGGLLKSRSNKTNPKKTKRNKKNRRKNGSSLRTR